MIDDTLKKQRFVAQKCPNCNGYTTVTFKRLPCPVCRAKGFLIIDQETGVTVDDENNEKPDS